MVKKGELRIGNLLHAADLSCSNVDFTSNGVSAITGLGIGLVENNKAHFYPIPLSDSMLLSMGFTNEQNSEGIEWIHENEYFFLSKDRISGKLYYFGSPKNFYIEYVHQLQNIHFAITGQELTLR